MMKAKYFYCETQISKTKCIEICKSNNPAISGGYNTPPLGVELVTRACSGVHTRDIITFLLIFFLFANQGWAADWGFRGLLPRGTGYYDKSSIKKINKNITQVWTVTIYNEKGKADAFSILKKQDKAPDNPEILSQELVLLEFDCVNEKYRIASMDIYDEKENLLLSVPEIDAEWHDIIPNSINEILKKIVCSVGENSNKEKK